MHSCICALITLAYFAVMQLWDEIAASPARVTVIGATNRPQDLDAAIQRRFERSFLIGMPNEQDRARIIKILLRGIPVHPRFDYGHAARLTDRYTPSDLVSVCKAAAFIPLNEYRVSLQRAERISREKALAVDEAMKSKEFERKEQTEGSSLIEHHGPSEGSKDGIRLLTPDEPISTSALNRTTEPSAPTDVKTHFQKSENPVLAIRPLVISVMALGSYIPYLLFSADIFACLGLYYRHSYLNTII